MIKNKLPINIKVDYELDNYEQFWGLEKSIKSSLQAVLDLAIFLESTKFRILVRKYNSTNTYPEYCIAFLGNDGLIEALLVFETQQDYSDHLTEVGMFFYGTEEETAELLKHHGL